MLKIADKQQNKPRMSHHHKLAGMAFANLRKNGTIQHKLLLNNRYSEDHPRLSAWQSKNVLQL